MKEPITKPNTKMDTKSAIVITFLKWWNVLTHPSIATFAKEITEANLKVPTIGVFIFICTYIITVISGITPWYGNITIRPILVLETEVYLYCINAVIIVGLIVRGIWEGMKIRQDGFVVYTYLYSLYITPLLIISYLFSLATDLLLVGLLVAFIYGLLLTYYMVQAAYGMSAISARNIVYSIFRIPLFVFISYLIFLLFTFGGF